MLPLPGGGRKAQHTHLTENTGGTIQSQRWDQQPREKKKKNQILPHQTGLSGGGGVRKKQKTDRHRKLSPSLNENAIWISTLQGLR